MRWNVSDIVDAVATALRKRAAADDREQAVYSIDALDELRLHPIIQQGLRETGLGVWPEQRYPSQRSSSGRKKKSEGKRCDVVLTHSDVTELVDPDAEATLFSPPDALPLEAAYWLEIKTVSQFTTEGPFGHYSKELLSPVSQDIRKLAQDRLIFHAGLLLVLFTADEQVARHDLKTWESRCLLKGLPVAGPTVREFRLTDRLGNGQCTVALFPVRRL
jgi:hypothetical protein